MFDLKSVIRPNILHLQPYRCARDDFKAGILLDANENTHGPALTNVSSHEQDLELNRYPDPHQIELKEQIIKFRNSQPNKLLQDFDNNKLRTDNLCLGVGSDESIDLLLRCVCAPGKEKMLICPPTYGMYSICATVNDVAIEKVPLLYPGFGIDVSGIAEKVEADPAIKLVYITSPGNPTGKLVSVSDIVELLERLEKSWNGLVVVDEAYIDFTLSAQDKTSESVTTLVNQYPNLVALQTLSKSFGLAGIRLGITYCCSELSRFLNAMKYPYNISSLTSNVALRTTDPENGLSTMFEFVEAIKEQRDWVLKSLQEFKYIGKNIGGLDSNFLLIEILDKEGKPSNEVAYALYNKLATSNSIIVRFRGKELNCTGALRISTGTAEENKLLVETLKANLEQINS